MTIDNEAFEKIFGKEPHDLDSLLDYNDAKRNFYIGFESAKADSAQKISELKKMQVMVTNANIDLAKQVTELQAHINILRESDAELIDKYVQAILNVGGKRVWEFVDAVKSVGDSEPGKEDAKAKLAPFDEQKEQDSFKFSVPCTDGYYIVNGSIALVKEGKIYSSEKFTKPSTNQSKEYESMA